MCCLFTWPEIALLSLKFHIKSAIEISSSSSREREKWGQQLFVTYYGCARLCHPFSSKLFLELLRWPQKSDINSLWFSSERERELFATTAENHKEFSRFSSFFFSRFYFILYFVYLKQRTTTAAEVERTREFSSLCLVRMNKKRQRRGML